MHRADKLPQFLIIGAQKCGTSWLHACLREHSAVFLPADKDNEIDFRQPEQLAILLQRLSLRGEQQWVGDACAAWFWTRRGDDPVIGQPRNIVDDIADVLGTETKLMVLVRDPIQRAISGYLHHIQQGSLHPDCSILEANPALGIVTLSRYGYHLHNWLQRFPAEKIIVLPAPAEADTDEIFHQVLRFLQLEVPDPAITTDRHVMPGLRKVMREDGVWVKLDNTQARHWQRNIPITQIDQHTHARLISNNEIETLVATLAEDTRWFLQQAGELDWWHPAFSKWYTE